MTQRFSYGPALAGALLAAGLLVFFPSWPPWLGGSAAVLLALVPPLAAGWRGARRRLKDRYLSRGEYHHLESGPEDWPRLPAAAGLEEIGYRAEGYLRLPDGSVRGVYVHERLPAYALVHRVNGGLSVDLESFFEGGCRLTTTSSRARAALGAAAAVGPRLVQLRPEGTPQALEGQHAGTVSAWMAGKRRPKFGPAGELPGYLEEDDRIVREYLAARGWLSFPDYVRSLLGMGILKF